MKKYKITISKEEEQVKNTLSVGERYFTSGEEVLFEASMSPDVCIQILNQAYREQLKNVAQMDDASNT